MSKPLSVYRLNLAESIELRRACDFLLAAREIIRKTTGCFGARLNTKVDALRMEVLRTSIHGQIKGGLR